MRRRIRDDTGRYRIEPTGLEHELMSIDRYEIRPDDPRSARAEITHEMRQGRHGWQVRAVTRTVLTATETAFRIEAWLDAWEGEQHLLARGWNGAVPRHLV